MLLREDSLSTPKREKKSTGKKLSQLQLEKVAKQKEAKKKALAKITRKMKQKVNDNGEVFLKY